MNLLWKVSDLNLEIRERTKEEGDEREINDEEKTDNTVMTIVMAVTTNNS